MKCILKWTFTIIDHETGKYTFVFGSFIKLDWRISDENLLTSDALRMFFYSMGSSPPTLIDIPATCTLSFRVWSGLWIALSGKILGFCQNLRLWCIVTRTLSTTSCVLVPLQVTSPGHLVWCPRTGRPPCPSWDPALHVSWLFISQMRVRAKYFPWMGIHLVVRNLS